MDPIPHLLLDQTTCFSDVECKVMKLLDKLLMCMIWQSITAQIDSNLEEDAVGS